jgi:S1/P1 nuclease
MIRNWRVYPGLLVLLLLSQTKASAWHETGHKVVTCITYRELPPDARKKTVELLCHHPYFSQWKREFPGGRANSDFGLYLLARASVWPDEIGGSGSPFEHPSWHYINYPLRPPGFEMQPGPAHGETILWAIERCQSILGDKGASTVTRAVHLSWLIHLIGDLHQPLHCSNLINERFPEGDRGGNLFFVRADENAMTLHAFWDGLLSQEQDTRKVLNLATRVRSEYPRSRLSELKADSVKTWSLEGRDLAVEQVYLHGKLPGSDRPEDAPPLPHSYAASAKAVAKRRIALAGYRLSDLIRVLVQR